MIGQTVSHHRVLERLGAGGMGVVYKAEDLKLSRPVALKFLSLERADDRQAIERFQREARTASSLNHPNICTIYEVDEHEGLQFIAMELLQGQPLDRRIGGKPLPIDEVLDLGIQMADALDTAHGQGILHRDIKPANIFITTRGQCKILDFGLAKLAESHRAAKALDLSSDPTCDRDQFATTQGMTVGTIAYMSPEQARGEDLDLRSDLFSLGIVLYEMATGRQGFSGNTSAVIFDAILNREPPAPVELNAEVPFELERIIAKAIDKDRRLRYQTAAEIRTDLQRLKRNRESNRVAATAAVAPVSGSATRWPSASDAKVAVAAAPKTAVPVRPSRWLWMVAVIGTLCLAGAGVFLLQAGRALTSLEPSVMTVAPPSPLTLAPTPTLPSGPSPSPPSPAPSVRAEAPPAVAPPQPPAVAPAQPPPAAANNIDPAAERLRIARSKFDAKLYDQALTDLKSIADAFPRSPSAPGAYLLMAGVFEAQGRVEDALASYVELRDRYRTSAAAAEGTYAMASVLLRTNRSDRDRAALELWGDVATTYANTQWAPRALVAKASLEERSRARAQDPRLGVTVPASLISYRTLVESYPESEAAENAWWRMAEMYEDMNRFALAAQALESLASRFPGNRRDAQWRAAELYDRRVKDPALARAAYARVPSTSSRYREAQRRAGN